MEIKDHLSRLKSCMSIDEIARAANVDRSTVIRASKPGAVVTLRTYQAIMRLRPRKVTRAKVEGAA